MTAAAATERDDVVVECKHTREVTSSSGSTDVPYQGTFTAKIDKDVSANVFIGGMGAALKNSIASSNPAHTPVLLPAIKIKDPDEGTSGTITQGSKSVSINRHPAARDGDTAKCCEATGKVVVVGTRTVFIGG